MRAPNWKRRRQEVAPEAPSRPSYVPDPDAEANRKRNAVAVRKQKSAERASGPGLKNGENPCTSEVEYTADEVEFSMAMEKYRREARRPFPTNREILRVLRRLGYRKVADKEE